MDLLSNCYFDTSYTYPDFSSNHCIIQNSQNSLFQISGQITWFKHSIENRISFFWWFRNAMNFYSNAAIKRWEILSNRRSVSRFFSEINSSDSLQNVTRVSLFCFFRSKPNYQKLRVETSVGVWVSRKAKTDIRVRLISFGITHIILWKYWVRRNTDWTRFCSIGCVTCFTNCSGLYRSSTSFWKLSE